ncbi:MAG: tetratricopeptide repeat protein [Bryobacteraceae bacterium]
MLALAILGVLLFAEIASAQGILTDPLINPGFDHFYNLEFTEAIAEFRKQLAAAPDSPEAHNHLAQSILYRELYKTGALESELVTGNNPFVRRADVNPSAEEQREFDQLISQSIQLAEKKIDANPRDKEAYYALGVARGLRSNYLFLIRKSWIDALRDASAARKAHEKATDIDPDFIDARLTQGVYAYLVGNLSFMYRIMGFIGGFRGDKEGGIRILEKVYNEGRRNSLDAGILLAAIYRRERRPREAIPLVETMIAACPRNYIFRMELAQMYGDAGDKESALGEFRAVDELRRKGAPGFAHLTEEQLRYSRGNLLFWYGDTDRALVDMKAATSHPDRLDLNTSVLAWMRLGQLYDLKGQRKDAQSAYRQAIAAAPQAGAAKEAKKYLSRPYKRSSKG